MSDTEKKEIMEQIYKNTINNSVGEEKSCDYIKKSKPSKLKIALASVLVAFTLTTSVGCAIPLENIMQPEKTESEQSSLTEFNGFSRFEIVKYREMCAKSVLTQNGIEYEMVEGKIHSEASAEEFSRIPNLEDYYYVFSVKATPETFKKILKAHGYNSVEEFKEAKGYSSDYEWSNIDVEYWSTILAADLEEEPDMGGR